MRLLCFGVLILGEAVAGAASPYEYVKDAPMAAAVLVTVGFFLKALSKRDKEHQDQQQRWFEAWKAWNEAQAQAHRDERKEAFSVLEKSAEILGSVRDYLADLKRTS